MPYLPIPTPWTLRLIKGSALTHAELDDNQKILNQKINDTTGNNVGGGIGFFIDKTTNANDGALNFRTFSGIGSSSVFVSGDTIIISGDSAIGTDIYTTGFTYNNSILTLKRNDNINLSVTITGFSTTDTFVTGGTYNNLLGTATFKNNTGGTFTVTGFTTGTTDTYVTGFTYTAPQTIILRQNRVDQYSAFSITLSGLSNTDVYVTGGTFNNGTATFTNNTGGTFNVTGFTTGTTDTYVTGFTYTSPQTVILNQNRTDQYSSFTVTLSGLSTGDTFVTGATFNNSVLSLKRNDGITLTTTITGFSTLDTYVTGFTYDNANTLTITNSTGGSLSVLVNTMTGLTVNGTLSATTISATTYLNYPTYSISTYMLTNLSSDTLT